MDSASVSQQRPCGAADDAQHVGLPYAEASPPDEAYDDASVVARTYPVVRLPFQTVVDTMATEVRWQRICEELSSQRALERPYLE